MIANEKRLEEVFKILRKLIVECSREAPNLKIIEKITGEKYPEIKTKPFWRTVAHEIKEDSSSHLQATHLAVLSTRIILEEFFGHTFVLYEMMVEIKRNPKEIEFIGLCDAIRSLHEVQQAVEEQKLSSKK